MNKKLLLGAAFLGLSSIASAQILSEDFSDGGTNWTIDNENGGTPMSSLGTVDNSQLPGARVLNPFELNNNLGSYVISTGDYVMPDPDNGGSYKRTVSVYEYNDGSNPVVEVEFNGYNSSNQPTFITIDGSDVVYTPVDPANEITGPTRYIGDGVDDNRVGNGPLSYNLNNNMSSNIDVNMAEAIWFAGEAGYDLTYNDPSDNSLLLYQGQYTTGYWTDNVYTVTYNNTISVTDINQTVSFSSYGYADLGVAAFEIKINGGAWTELWQSSRWWNNQYPDENPVESVSINLKDEINVSDTYEIRFSFSPRAGYEGASNRGDWFVDNVVIDATPAENIVLSNAFHGSNTSATDWDAAALPNGWDSIPQVQFFAQIGLNTLDATPTSSDSIILGARMTNKGASDILASDLTKSFELSVSTVNNGVIYTETKNLPANLVAYQGDALHVAYAISPSLFENDPLLSISELGIAHTYTITAVGFDNADVAVVTGTFYVHPNVTSKESAGSYIPAGNDYGVHSALINDATPEMYLTNQTGAESVITTPFSTEQAVYFEEIAFVVGGLNATSATADQNWKVEITNDNGDVVGSTYFEVSATELNTLKVVSLETEELVGLEVVVTPGIFFDPSVNGKNYSIDIYPVADLDGTIDFALAIAFNYSYVDNSDAYNSDPYQFDIASDAGRSLTFLPVLKVKTNENQPDGPTGIIGNDKTDAFETSIYPNPTSANATVTYALTEKSNVIIEVRDITGKLIISENRGVELKGNKTFKLNTQNLRAGVYFYSVGTTNAKVTKRFSVIK